ncbi:MAG: hypothetical protein CNLJKLNK_01196 [Holosporales bacterium]
MKDCRRFANVILNPLSQAYSIGSNFLMNCTSIRKIDLDPLTQVTRIGSGLLGTSTLKLKNNKHCVTVCVSASHLMSGDFNYTNFLNAFNRKDIVSKRIKLMACFKTDNFLTRNQAQMFNLTAFNMFLSLRGGFLNQCRFEKVDLTPLEDIENIDRNFLRDCTRLESLEI